MPHAVSRSVRYAFLAFSGVLLVLAGVQSIAAPADRMGLSSCGWAGNPCVLEELVVKAPPAAVAAEAEPELARRVGHLTPPRPEGPASRI